MADIAHSIDAESAFRVSLSRTAGQATVVLEGEIDIASEVEMKACIADALRTLGPLRIDLSAVTFMGSSGVNVLRLAYKAAGEAKEAVTLLDPPPRVRQLLDLAGVTNFFTIVP